MFGYHACLSKLPPLNGPKTLEAVDADFGSAEADDGVVGLVCGVDGAVLDVAEADPEDPEVGVTGWAEGMEERAGPMM